MTMYAPMLSDMQTIYEHLQVSSQGRVQWI